MHFDGSVPGQESWLGNSTPDYDITPITPALLRKVALTADKHGIGRANPVLDDELASYIYRVDTHDVLSITIWGGTDVAQAFSPTAAAGGQAALYGSSDVFSQSGTSAGAQPPGFDVAGDGTIYFPYIGRVPVSGLTTEEISAELTKRLPQFIKNPQITVSVSAYRSQKFQLTGAVEHPGLYPITNVPVTVSQAISGSGGVSGMQSRTGNGFGPNVGVSGDLDRVIYVHNHVSQALNIRAVLQYGDAMQDRLLQPGDVVFVPDASSEQIHLLGEVKQPGNYPLIDGELNLSQLLGNAGGFDMDSANPSRIFVFRGSYQKPDIYWLDASSPDAMLLANQFELRPQDVVYVAPAGLVSWDRFLAQILPTIQAIYFTKAITQ
jgi:polysaccharide export outer membrane protein